MHKRIEAALNHSPRHANQIAEALAGVPRNDIVGAAQVVRKQCEKHRIADFPNPFPADTDEHKTWADAWFMSGEQWTDEERAKISAQAGVSGEVYNYDTMTKAEIAELVMRRTGKKISTWSTKKAVIARAKDLLEAQA